MKKLIFVILMGILSLNFQCGGSGETDNADKTTGDTAQQKPEVLSDDISPNHCRIEARIISIDKTPVSTNPSDPRSKVPSRAQVNIVKVIGYGSAFGSPLPAGKEITVDFAFTLNPTKDIFPDMTASYPGLKEGNVFIADLEAREVLSREGGTNISYKVYGYEIK
ncbi:hypothetical protein ACFL7D_02995 [candidate division KSB1 bacterium]